MIRGARPVWDSNSTGSREPTDNVEVGGAWRSRFRATHKESTENRTRETAVRERLVML